MRLIFLFLVLSIPALAQSGWKKVPLPDSHGLYLEKGRPSKKAGYDIWQTTITPRGWLLLFPGMGMSDLEGETAIARNMVSYGIVTVVPRINNRLFWEQQAEKAIEAVVTAIRQEEGLTDSLAVFIGGFSSGGHLALTLAENRLLSGQRVDAVFAVDPPTDLLAYYEMGQRRIQMNACPLLIREGKQMVEMLEKYFGGSPSADTCSRYSAYSRAGGGRAKVLTQTPVRLYAEPDTAFWKKEFCGAIEYEDLNAASATRLMQFLQDAGNKQAKLILTQHKGFWRGRRFPHAWSIAEPAELAEWLGSMLKK